jgi:hypothetical protein
MQVYLQNGSGGMPGGAYFLDGFIYPYNRLLTPATLATYCGFTSVTNFVANGPNGTFAGDDYYGFSFDGVDPADGLEYSYEYAFSGATTTVRIATKTLAAGADTTPPTIGIAALSGPTGGVYTAAITVSEATTDLVVGDLGLTNATATLTGSGTSYSATLTPIAQGLVELSVGVGQFSDGAGNLNTAASNVVATTYDSIDPTVAITGIPGTITGVTTFSATVTFSEIVTGFDASNIGATNASVTGVTGTGASYSATVTTTGSGDVVLSIPAGAAIDASGNPSVATASTGVVNQTVMVTQDVIAHTMFSRANALVSNQPRLTELLTGGNTGAFSADVTQGNGAFDLTTETDRPFWLHLRGAWSTVGAAETEYAFGAVGTHLKYSENLLVGAMVQFDYAETTDGTASSNGTGWMAGPYVVARLENQPVFFEGSLLYGQTENEVSSLGTYTDSFGTERFLATAGVTGEVETSRMTLYPNLRFSHTEDTQLAYVDSLSNAIGEQSITLSELSAGMDFSMPVEVDSGEMVLTGGLNGIWSQTSASGGAASVVPEYEGGRTRLNLGFGHTGSSGMNTRVSAFYDGLGTETFESYGIDVVFDLQF